jgi:hypothetical protein
MQLSCRLVNAAACMARIGQWWTRARGAAAILLSALCMTPCPQRSRAASPANGHCMRAPGCLSAPGCKQVGGWDARAVRFGNALQLRGWLDGARGVSDRSCARQRGAEQEEEEDGSMRSYNEFKKMHDLLGVLVGTRGAGANHTRDLLHTSIEWPCLPGSSCPSLVSVSPCAHCPWGSVCTAVPNKASLPPAAVNLASALSQGLSR